MIHRFSIYGDVRGQGRPRMRRNGRVYKASEDRKWEDLIKESYINSGGVCFHEKPLIIAAIIYRKMPDSRPKYREAEMDVYKPDASNILKSIEDALNGIAYKDDKQIIAAIPIKMPRTKRMGEHIDVMITDEINVADLLMRVEGLFNQ